MKENMRKGNKKCRAVPSYNIEVAKFRMLGTQQCLQFRGTTSRMPLVAKLLIRFSYNNRDT